MERVKKKRDAVLRAGTTVGFLSLPPLLAPRQETPRLGARKTHLEARKPASRRENLVPPPASGRGKLASVREKFVQGGVPLGCPPSVEIFPVEFSTKKSYAKFSAHRSAVFAQFFAPLFVAFFAPWLAAPQPPPAVPPPPGARASA